MFKPSTVLIQSDVNGGNDNLFDAVQDYLFQSSNKNKNSIEKEFQTKNENTKAVVNEIENENEVFSQIDNKIKSNQNKIFFKKKLQTLIGSKNEGEIVKINEFKNFTDLNKNKKRKILSVDNLPRCVKKVKQEINQKNDEKVIFGDDKMQTNNSNYDENIDSGSNDINIGKDNATNHSNDNNDNEHDNIDNNNDRSGDNIHHRAEHAFEDTESESFETQEGRKINKAGASAELYLIHRYVRYCGNEISPTFPVMLIAFRVLRIAYYPFFFFQSLVKISLFSYSFPFSSSPSSPSPSSSSSLFLLFFYFDSFINSFFCTATKRNKCYSRHLNYLIFIYSILTCTILQWIIE